MGMNHTARSRRSPLAFFGLLLATSVPVWLVGAVVERLLPKDRPVNLPVSALMAFNPLLVAAMLTYRESGRPGVTALLRKPFDYRNIQNKAWYAPVFLTMPTVMLLEYGITNWAGSTIPDPQVHIEMAPLFFAVFFIAAIGEELGWQGYVYDPLEERWGALGAALIIGVVWAAWHIIPNAQAGHSTDWMVWQFINTVALRVLIVWLYRNTNRSVFAAVAFHTMINVSNFLYPNYGSYYDPRIAGAIASAAALAVILLWYPTSDEGRAT
jgi:membrane protease YdiL (CAAX protease family)